MWFWDCFGIWTNNTDFANNNPVQSFESLNPKFLFIDSKVRQNFRSLNPKWANISEHWIQSEPKFQSIESKVSENVRSYESKVSENVRSLNPKQAKISDHWVKGMPKFQNIESKACQNFRSLFPMWVKILDQCRSGFAIYKYIYHICTTRTFLSMIGVIDPMFILFITWNIYL